MRKYSFSLLQKVLLATTLILLPIIITFIYNYKKDREHLEEYIKNDLTVMAEAYEGQVYQFIEMSRQRVQDFASDGVIRKHFQDIIEGSETGDQFLNTYLSRYTKPIDKSVHSISLLTFDGRIMASTDSSRIGKYFSIEIDTVPRTEGIPVVEKEMTFSGMEQIVVLAPVFSIPQEKPIGIIANHIFLSELNRLLTGELIRNLGAKSRDVGRRKTMEVYLVNKDMLMITESKFIKNSILRQSVDSPPVQVCLKDNKEMTGFYRNYRGVEVAGASMCIPSMKWTLLAEIDRSEVMEPLEAVRRSAIAGSIIVIGLIITFFIFLFRNVIVPLRRLSYAANDFAKGNYSVSLPAESRDEIGNLSNSFNKMAEEITQRSILIKNSEERLLAIINNSPAVIYLKDSDGRYILVNRRFEELFRLTNDKISGKTDFDLFASEFASTFRENDIKVLKSGRPVEFDEVVPQDDGLHHYISVKFPLFDIAGLPLAVCGISTDITERTRMNEEKLELQKKYEDLVNNLNVGIYRISESGDIIEANMAAIMLSETESKDELLQHNVRDLFLNQGDFSVFMRRILKNGSIENVETELQTVKGNKFHASISAVLKRDTDGRVYIDGVIEDITKLKRLEVQLRLAQKMEAVGQLAGGIAHDFNNILTGITGYSTLLSMKTETDQVLKGYASHIISLSDKAANLTQGLLAFSKRQVMNIEVHDLNDIIKRFISMVTRIIGEDIEIISRPSDKPLLVMADPTQIEQVMMNLVTNAKDAMVKGGTIIIETSLISADDFSLSRQEDSTKHYYALLRFIDTGTGMPAEVKDKIFDPFFTTKEVGKGTGLGLSVVHGIIEQHNGKIEVESEPGKGTTFNIFMPITDALITRRIEPAALFNLPHGKETILLAEDDMPARMTAKTILEEFGYNIIEAGDGEEAVNKFSENIDKIQLIIMDMIMPRMDGRTAFEQIRRIKPDIKVIFTSGYLSEMMKVRDIIEEELNFISKPVAPDELLMKIREVINLI